MNVPKEVWTKYTISSKDYKRVKTSSGSSNRYIGLRYKKDKLIITNSNIGHYSNCLYEKALAETIAKTIQPSWISRPYYKTSENIEAYKFILNGVEFFIDVEAFEHNHYGNNLNEITELPEDVVAHGDASIYNLSKYMQRIVDHIGRMHNSLVNEDKQLLVEATGEVLFHWSDLGQSLDIYYLGHKTIEETQISTKDEFEDWFGRFTFDLAKMSGYESIAKEIDLAYFTFEDEEEN